LTVLPEQGNDSPEVYFIESRKTIDRSVLSVAGLLLDGGIETQVVLDQLPTAESYVSVCELGRSA
jgi:hypothetical protein